MKMDAMLREKRRALGLTQEQVANALGVTTPAVNKWEKGATCPDIALLPALARLLKTDPNTLLDFEERLSHQEIWDFLNATPEIAQKEGVAQCFAVTLAKTHAYPNCTELLYSAAMQLDGLLLMSALSAAEKEEYNEQILSLYSQVAKSEDPKFADSANYMLASKRIARGEYAEAQAALDSLPEWKALDKRGMQADLWQKQGESAKAAALLERKLTLAVQDNQTTLCRLIRLATEAGDEKTADALAEAAQKECEAFLLGDYWGQIGPLELAEARQDIPASLAALAILLEGTNKAWGSTFSPLFTHQPHADAPAGFGAQMRKPLLSMLVSDPKYAYLREAPEFRALLAPYAAEM